MSLLLLWSTLAGCGGKDSVPVLPGDDTGSATLDSDPADTDAAEAWPMAEPWLRDAERSPGPVTFNELHYHPPEGAELEWIELHNPMVYDMDLSGWSLSGGVLFDFPQDTVLGAGDTLVLAAAPAALQEATGFDEALGPWEGKLSNGGERLELLDPAGRRIDSIAYGDDEPWPVAPDGSGLTLAKLDPDSASDLAESWAASSTLGGSPGDPNALDPTEPPVTLELVPWDATWSYELSGLYPAEDWADPDFDDADWDSGEAIFYVGGTENSTVATAWATADNYFSMYLGAADGADLVLVGEDGDGSWTTVEEIELEPLATDHLYLAAWELTGDSTSPQMLIAEVELGSDAVGTNTGDFEWVLGPSFDNPGALPTNAPPAEEALAALVGQANDEGSWAAPGVESSHSSSPWGSSVSGSFSEAASFIWADSFDYDSITNSEDTWALFRSVEPLIRPLGDTELSELPTTALFRTSFSFSGDPASAELWLDCVVDDGAVFYLNGVEVHRENMPTGEVDESTLASAEVRDSEELYAEISSEALVTGDNLLAVELHQATDEDLDLLFGCSLWAEVQPDSGGPTILLNELPAADETPLWVELVGASELPQDATGLILASSSGQEIVLSEGELASGELLLIEELELDVESGDRLFLYTADGGELLDAVRILDRPRARAQDAGPWHTPSETTPGTDNRIELTTAVVINEIQYHRAPISREGEPVTERSEEWIELTNLGDEAVDLEGWQLVDGVAFEFAAGTVIDPGGFLVVTGDADALRADHPDIEVVGDWEGRLSNSGERILLLDAAGNPADELRYFDGGRWPKAADGGGLSLELLDPWADNAVAEAWAASEEGERAAWVEVSFRGEATSSPVGPDGQWEELVLGLLDAGEVLIDDLSVLRDPGGEAEELVQDGGFDDSGESWRLLGNHRHSEVVPDPEDPSNPVLRLVATGPTGHMHNHAETTLLQEIESAEYEISLRARWVSGSNQLHSRLYFNRLPLTTLVEQPEASGTPGAENSVRVDNLGPTLSGLTQDVAVPGPGAPVEIRVSAADPDGVQQLTLWSSVDGGSWQEQAMSEEGEGSWSAELEGQAEGSVVQLYVEATDTLGESASYPAGGADSRALYLVDDGDDASTTGLHDLRIILTPDDADWLHEDVNLMSNDRVGATVVYRQRRVFYDVGVRLKGSQRGRPTDSRLGYGLRFRDDEPFRGHHTSVLIDRSEGVGYGQREVLMNLVMTHGGSVSAEYNDLVQLQAPDSAYTGAAELQLDRFTNGMLDAQFEDGSSGTRFEYELIYYPTSTDDGTPEGLKLPQPDSVVGTGLADLGDSKEDYRWNFLIGNKERQDDYDALITLCQSMGLSSSELHEVAEEIIDVDQWLRAFAFATLSGATDQYAAGSQHNAVFYLRPSDGRFLYFPHDLDYIGGSTMSVVGSSDLDALISEPAWHRLYYGHLVDILDRVYNSEHLGPWCEQLGERLPGQDFEGHCEFVDERASWVLEDSSDSVAAHYPAVDFEITTGGGGDVSVSDTEITLEGQAWVDVREIELQDASEAIEVRWVDGSSWELTVPLDEGDNELVLVATDLRGQEVGSASIVVTRTGGR